MTESSGWPGPWVIEAAQHLAHDLLAETGDRWAHTQGVAGQANVAAPALPVGQRPALVAAAWLHDIGYAEGLHDTGFHPLDGARFLQRNGWPPVIAGLVAHHSGARFVAAERGLDTALAHFCDPVSVRGALADALVLADQTTSPTGEPVEYEDRMAEMLHRHGPGSPQARAQALRGPVLAAAVTRARRALLVHRLAADLAEPVTLHGRS